MLPVDERASPLFHVWVWVRFSFWESVSSILCDCRRLFAVWMQLSIGGFFFTLHMVSRLSAQKLGIVWIIGIENDCCCISMGVTNMFRRKLTTSCLYLDFFFTFYYNTTDLKSTFCFFFPHKVEFGRERTKECVAGLVMWLNVVINIWMVDLPHQMRKWR